ncbi:MAG: glycosyltransferase family 39 protein [Legionellales bacterium]|nr:glycosyltransferase family 39 protein [Legionellales bacterium]
MKIVRVRVPTNRVLPVFLGAYFLLFGMLFYHARLCQDAYYYWAWSQDLALSYYDGPPLIAYLLRLYTIIFGEHEFSLYLFSLSATAATAWLIWQCALLLFNRATARYAVLLWLLTPGTLHFFTLQVTYNPAMIIFWGLSFYYFLQIIYSQKKHYYYLLGTSLGCLLLAKYTGILLIISLFFACIGIKKYRFLLKQVDLYLGLTLALLIFSPVLIWNYQHHWISFKYQLSHGFQAESTAHLHQILAYIMNSIIDYNVCLLALIVLIWQNKSNPLGSQRCILLFPTVLVFCFFLVSSFFATTQSNWNAPFFFTGAILLASYLAPMQNKRLCFLLFFFLIASNACLVMGDRWPKFAIQKQGGWSGVYATQKILSKIPITDYQNKIILTDHSPVISAMMTYFLKNHPAICPTNLQDPHYYSCWQHNASELKKSFIYLSAGPISTPQGLLAHCELKKHYTSTQKRLLYAPITWHLHWYDCQPPISTPLRSGTI